MIMLGRPVLADPDWCAKAYAGRVEDIRPCIGCQEGCINEFVEGGHPQCAVNPRTGFEDVIPAEPAPAEKPKRIGVVGGGPAGMILTYYATGFPVDLMHAAATVLFLWILADPMLEKLDRVKVKYGLLERENV